VIASVEIELEAAIEKCRGAEKDLAKSIRELARAIAAEQAELKKYQPGEAAGLLNFLFVECWLRCRG
jgi:prefoldin subunit 5